MEKQFNITIKPGAKSAKVEQAGENILNIWVKAPPKEGKANAELLKILSKHFKVPKSAIRMKRGVKSRRKTIIIDN